MRTSGVEVMAAVGREKSITHPQPSMQITIQQLPRLPPPNTKYVNICIYRDIIHVLTKPQRKHNDTCWSSFIPLLLLCLSRMGQKPGGEAFKIRF